MANPVHASIDELRTLDKSIRDKMLLMHYSDDYEGQDTTGFMGLAFEGVRYVFD